MLLKLANNATALLAVELDDDDDVEVAVTTGFGTRFPALSAGEWFPLTVVDSEGGLEIMRATARAGDVITVTRAQEGTTKRAFTVGARVELRITAAALVSEFTALAEALATETAARQAADTALQTTLDLTRPRTGDVLPTYDDTAPSGWLMMADQTIGNTSSGATYANALAENLYVLLWNKVSNSWAPVTGGRGANAAADWAAQKPMALPKVLGRALAAAGAGSGLTSRALGGFIGAETHTLLTEEMPTHAHGVTDLGHVHEQSIHGPRNGTGGSGGWADSSTLILGGVNTQSATTNISIQNAGGGGAHNNMQPTAFMNFKIKL